MSIDDTAQEFAPLTAPRHDWSLAEIITLYRQPLNDLLHRAHAVHRSCFDPNRIQLSTLLNIKSGGCPEDCAYCPQSVRYKTGVENEGLMSCDQVLAEAQRAKASGAKRFCMGAAWRGPKDRDIDRVAEMISGVRTLGLETCVTLGMLKPGQAEQLKSAGLDYYNHNLDTSENFYSSIISTRTFQERLDTLQRVRDAGINVCCGGIIGMGESVEDRAGLLQTLACLPRHPESVPINTLVKVAGTPLAEQEDTDPIDLVRTVACARILMPGAYVRLSAGRTEMSDSTQALCYFAGANSIFYGEKLLTTENPQFSRDQSLFERLGLSTDPSDTSGEAHTAPNV
ncbi:MAG: biotin synthase BioB [Gammaproteobacteria bacterium]|nr:biotin synthase BioB [Gammaproteobacteria bacterium]